MDKIAFGEGGTAISNDRATIIKLLNIESSPAKSGTTCVMILSGELFKEARQFIEDGISP